MVRERKPVIEDYALFERWKKFFAKNSTISQMDQECLRARIELVGSGFAPGNTAVRLLAQGSMSQEEGVKCESD